MIGQTLYHRQRLLQSPLLRVEHLDARRFAGLNVDVHVVSFVVWVSVHVSLPRSL
jgi:hypothetical protein